MDQVCACVCMNGMFVVSKDLSLCVCACVCQAHLIKGLIEDLIDSVVGHDRYKAIHSFLIDDIT